MAAMSISGPASRFNPRRDSPVVESLLRAVAAISKQLRSQGAKTPKKKAAVKS